MALNRNPYVMASHYRLAMVEERLGHRDVAVEHRKKADHLPRREASYEQPSANSSPPRRPGRIKRQAIQTCRP